MQKLVIALAFLMGLVTLAVAQAPPPVPALPDAPRLTSYNLTASTCACSVGFAIYGDGTDVDQWIDVFVNGVSYQSTDPTHGWSLSSATGSLGNIPRPITNAILTFASAQTGTVQIVGARRPRRVSQFSEGAGVSARQLNQVITDIIATQREMWDVDNRTIRGQPGDVFKPLPTATSRANQFLAFDNTGNVAVVPAPGSSSGGGPIFSSGIPAAGQVAVWQDTTHILGTSIINLGAQAGSPLLTADGYSVLAQNSSVTQGNIYTPQVPPGWFNWDNVRSVVAVPSGSTQVNANAFGAYVLNNNPAGGNSQSGVGYWSSVVCAVSNSNCWGENPTLADKLGTGTTPTGVKLIGSEIDFAVNSTTTTVIGISLNGTATVQPNSIGFACASLSAQAPGLARWGTCFISDDNNTQQGAYFGTLGPIAANTLSQPLLFGTVDSGGLKHIVAVDAAPAGPAAVLRVYDRSLANGVALQASATGQPVDIFPFGTDANISLSLGGKGTGTVQLPLITTGTPVASLCLDSANNIIKKTTTGPCL